MSLKVTCPKCASTFKVRELPPPGSKVKCARCSRGFVLDVRNVSGVDLQPDADDPNVLFEIQPASTAAPAQYAQPASYSAAGYPAQDPRPAVPVWMWATGGALSAVILFIVVLLATGGFDRNQAPTVPNRTVAERNRTEALLPQNRSASSTNPNPTVRLPRGSNSDPGQLADDATTKPKQPAAVSDNSDDSAPHLTLAMQPGLNYEYEFDITSGDQGKGPIKLNGVLSYANMPDTMKGPPPATTRGRRGFGGGSAFVVNSGGWLATCAHVVGYASKVEVAIGEKTYPASVVDKNGINDVALLKIDADDLHSLDVAATAPVQGNDVCVAGFPLTTMLGDSLKITHGRVAGFVKMRGQDMIQIDASVNPGNSGGPLVDSSGHVVGIVNAGLFGSDISAIGFASELKALKQLLAKHKVTWNASSERRTLSGSELATEVQPSVARVTVERGPQLPEDQFQVRYSGWLNSNNSRRHPSGFVRVSQQGDVVSADGQSDYSLVSTTTARLPFDRLPRAGERQWSASSEREVTFVDDNNSDDGSLFLGPRFGPRGPSMPFGAPQFPGSPFGRQNQNADAAGKRVSIEDKVNYELAELTADKAVVNTTLTSIRTAEPSGETIARIAGAGQYEFDRQRGVITSGFTELKLKVEQDGVETNIPLHLSFKLKDALTGDEIKDRNEKAQRHAQEMAAKSQADAAERTAKQKAKDKERVAKAIMTLKKLKENSSQIDILQALSELQFASVEAATPQQREAVGKQLNRFLKVGEESRRFIAISVARDWATTENIPVLLELLKAGESHHQIIRALGASGGDERSASVLAKLLETDSAHWAAEGLKGMTKYAEAAVLPLLKSPDKQTREHAAEVLEKVGGKKSLEPLEEQFAKADERGFERNRMKRAIDQIKKRLAVQPQEA